jgi:hypothetical protein
LFQHASFTLDVIPAVLSLKFFDNKFFGMRCLLYDYYDEECAMNSRDKHCCVQ